MAHSGHKGKSKFGVRAVSTHADGDRETTHTTGKNNLEKMRGQLARAHTIRCFKQLFPTVMNAKVNYADAPVTVP